jgi:hypothetical protein
MCASLSNCKHNYNRKDICDGDILMMLFERNRVLEQVYYIFQRKECWCHKYSVERLAKRLNEIDLGMLQYQI